MTDVDWLDLSRGRQTRSLIGYRPKLRHMWSKYPQHSVDPVLFYCWFTVYDAHPTLRQQWVNASSSDKNRAYNSSDFVYRSVAILPWLCKKRLTTRMCFIFSDSFNSQNETYIERSTTATVMDFSRRFALSYEDRSEVYNAIFIYHTLCSDFQYETYIGISPYRTLSVVWTAIYGSYLMLLYRVRKYKRCTSAVFSHIEL